MPDGVLFFIVTSAGTAGPPDRLSYRFVAQGNNRTAVNQRGLRPQPKIPAASRRITDGFAMTVWEWS